jgi:uncharacterized small protein (DUF1192 family)
MNEIEKQERMVWLEKEVARLKELCQIKDERIDKLRAQVANLKAQMLEAGVA